MKSYKRRIKFILIICLNISFTAYADSNTQKINIIGAEVLCHYEGCKEFAISLSSFCWDHIKDKKKWKEKIEDRVRMGKSLERFYLYKVDLSGADLRNANFHEADLREANLKGSNLIGANFQRSDLGNADLQEADMTDAIFERAHLEGANLQGTFLLKVNLQGADLSEANLENIKLMGANLQKANLTYANLLNANLIGANLQEVSLWYANLKRATLIATELQNAQLLGANLQWADLRQANLQWAILIDADFKNANLMGANLREADLREANLQGANLASVKLSRANLEGVNWGKDDIIKAERECNYDLAERIYREIKNAYSESGLHKRAGDFFYREMVMRRKQMKWYSPIRFIWLLVDGICGYGEKPFNVVISSLFSIVIFAFIYLLLPNIHSHSGITEITKEIGFIVVRKRKVSQMKPESELIKISLIEDWKGNFRKVLNCLYFSVGTLITLGYGDYRPKGYAKGVAMVESFWGIFMIALFIVTFGRQFLR